MQDYSVQYREKLTSAQSLAARVENGWRIGTDAAVSAPAGFLAALADRAAAEDLKDVWVQSMLDVYPFAFYQDSTLNGKLNGISWFSGSGARNACNFIFFRTAPTSIGIGLSRASG